MSRTIGEALADASERLARAGLEAPRREARLVLAAALDCDPVQVMGYPERDLDDAALRRVHAFLARRAAREPISRLRGEREFWGLPFALSEDTLDPRPDSETVVEAVLARLRDRHQPLRILDLGTGTGCLLLALLSELPRASGIGVDRAAGAAVTARRNAARLGLARRAFFMVGDWGEAISARFDVIVANPPYIPAGRLDDLPPEVRGHDPHRALDGGRDGLDCYRQVARRLPRLLARGGLFAGEVGFGQDRDAAAILVAAGLVFDGVAPDLSGAARCIVMRGPTTPAEKSVGLRCRPV